MKILPSQLSWIKERSQGQKRLRKRGSADDDRKVLGSGRGGRSTKRGKRGRETLGVRREKSLPAKGIGPKRAELAFGPIKERKGCPALENVSRGKRRGQLQA